MSPRFDTGFPLMTKMVSYGSTCRLTCHFKISISAMGVGRSKKEAKHCAAKALIDKLTGLNLSDSFYQQQKSFNSNGSPGAINSSNSTNFDEKNQMVKEIKDGDK